MKVVQFDSVGGASGDMILASLVALGADLAVIKAGLAPMGLEHFEIADEKVFEGGFIGVRIRVHTGSHGEHHHHRHLEDIEALIEKSGFNRPVKDLALAVFRRLAQAEAEVHGTSPAKVHFHEVGALDSIIDIVASCAALKQLGADAVKVGPLPLASGTVKCDHGIMPIPAPATVILLKGHPMAPTGETSELVTPTGAALLMTWQANMPSLSGAVMTMTGSGTAFGHRTLKERPNILRVMLMESADRADTDQCLVLECNLDDTVPELLGSLSQKLIDSGALDVFATSIQMKKQRPGTMLTVLCKPADREKCLELIFRESTTFGVREHMTNRTVLERRHVTVTTSYGDVRVKVGRWKGEDITRAPEHEDCRRLAEQKDVPVRSVYEAALRAK